MNARPTLSPGAAELLEALRVLRWVYLDDIGHPDRNARVAELVCLGLVTGYDAPDGRLVVEVIEA